MKERFTELLDGIFLLKTPFPPVWSGCILVKGEEPCLIDSGASDDVVTDVILPALNAEGMDLRNISWLLHTHCHGDHIGGHGKIRELYPEIRIAAIEQGREAIANPVAVAKRIRTRYPLNSPLPQCYLKGVEPDRILKDGEHLTDRLSVIHCPGHDSDCVSWFDSKTRTLICGDSLQGNGTITQGIAFYQDLNAYRSTLNRLEHLDPDNILAGHDYDGFGFFIEGKERTGEALDACLKVTYAYQDFIDRMIEQGITDTETIAAELINSVGCGMPAKLFLAMHSVDEHIKLYYEQRKGRQ